MGGLYLFPGIFIGLILIYVSYLSLRGKNDDSEKVKRAMTNRERPLPEEELTKYALDIIPAQLEDTIAWLCTNAPSKKTEQFFGFVEKTHLTIADGIVESANSKEVFITPVVQGWQLILGQRWIEIINDFTYDRLKAILEKASAELGEVQFFCQKPDMAFSMWAKAVDGKMQRIYVWLGEEEKNLLVEGDASEAEKEFNLVNTLLPENKYEKYLDNENILLPNEHYVYDLAAKWSISPKELIKNQTVYGKGKLGTIQI